MARRRYSRSISTAKAKVAALSRTRTPDDPEFIEARQNLAAANIAAYIERQVKAAPPLSDAQLDRITILLRPPGGRQAARLGTTGSVPE